MGVSVMVVPAIFQLVKFCLIAFVFTSQGSAGSSISPSPAFFSEIPSIEGTPFRSNAPSSESQPNESNVHAPRALPPLASAPPPLPQTTTGFVPSYAPGTIAPSPPIFQGNAPSSSPSIPIVSPPDNAAPPPSIVQGHLPTTSPNSPPRKPVAKAPVSVPSVPVPSAVPSMTSPDNAPAILPNAPVTSPSTVNGPPGGKQISPAPAVSQTGELPSNSPTTYPMMPGTPDISQALTPPPRIDHKKDGAPVAAPPAETPKSLPPFNNSPPKDSFPAVSPPTHKNTRHSNDSLAPFPSPPKSPLNKGHHSPAHSPSIPFDKQNHLRNKTNGPAPASSHVSYPHKYTRHSNNTLAPFPSPPNSPLSPAHSPSLFDKQNHSRNKTNGPAPASSHVSYPHKYTRRSNNTLTPFPSPPKSPLSPAHSPILFDKQYHSRNKTNGPAPASSLMSSPPLEQQGLASPPSFIPASQYEHHAPPPRSPGPFFASHHTFSKPVKEISPSPSPIAASSWTRMPLLSPKVSPPGSSLRRPRVPALPPIHTLPPPPPNEDCSSTVCTEPYANTPPGSPCGCVLPIQVGLRLSVALYTFFPLVSELAQEIASGVFMKQSQVRIMGANAASQQPEKTIVLVDLVPLGERFDNTTAFLTYQRFMYKQVAIKASFFGDYEVLYVQYPGLPASPPLAPSDVSIIDDGPYSGGNSNARTNKPLGVDIPKNQKDGLGGGVIAVIALSASVALVLCSVVVWVFLFRDRHHANQPKQTPQPLPPVAKSSAAVGSIIGSGLSSASLSFGSSIAPYTGSAKTFSSSEIEKATNNFDSSRILGEGGFGRVYRGTLEDGTNVAVKVLKRDDQQGGREFLAEIEMLSRLHHRNLVKLIGICTEERVRSLVYELIPNGSVESHLHGVDKEFAPLDWDARIKIALGAARGLAYLHEDSSPRVIHRDFKASNILLEHDFTPKVSDFGLARTAMDEENRHISTRVMGTFGYVAPEYAMTGHLLVKSDVYSYGVVLLELLTGRKPVDMSQPPGQENLVAWARPLLTSKEGLEMLIDPSLGPDVPFDSVGKVAAIASMCVQPEVSHRPFMGEVVQALKLVCNECDEAKDIDARSRSSSQDFSVDMDGGASSVSGQLPFQNQSIVPHYDSEPDIESGLSFSASTRYVRQESGSLRRCSSSGPVRTGRGKRLWERMRRMSGESVSEHGLISRLWPGSH